MKLIWPDLEHLPGYVAALEQGWSPDTLRPEAAAEELESIARDAAAFLALQVDREGKGPPITLPDGAQAPRLPGYRRWMWDGEFCGVIGFRWQPGTPELPAYCPGHIGYSVVPWKRQRGYATRALGLLLADVRKEGLPYVELVTEQGNEASRRVIEANGGVLAGVVTQTPHHGGGEALRYRIELTGGNESAGAP